MSLEPYQTGRKTLNLGISGWKGFKRGGILGAVVSS